jgi:hypothetical protein
MPFGQEFKLRGNEARRSAAILLAVIQIGVVLLTSCQSNTLDSGDGPAAIKIVTRGFSPAAVLSNMPENSDARCTGICLTAEAILDGELLAESGFDEPQELARRIYDAIGTRQPVHYRAALYVDGMPQPLNSRVALDRLSTVVADIYKERYVLSIASEQGRRRLIKAQTSFMRTRDELDRLLELDPDKIDAFCASGVRRFPDGDVRETHHVILVRKMPGGEKVVYDPNDPGSSIPCNLEDTAEGLTIEWTCRYRDTGKITTQIYRIVPKDTFFRLIFDNE